MDRYGGQPHEREPLDSGDHYEFAPQPPVHSDNSYYHQDSQYYDSPQHHNFSGPGQLPPQHNDYNTSNSSIDSRGNDFSPPPPPPSHGPRQQFGQQPIRAPRSSSSRSRGQTRGQPLNTITPGADNFGEAAAGGMAGIAYTVADHNARESGMEALRSTGQVPPPPSRAQFANQHHTFDQASISSESTSRGHDAYANLAPVGGPGGASHPASVEHSPSRRPYLDPYADDPYQGFSRRERDSRLGMLDPASIEDDGDDGLDYSKNSVRNSMLSSSQSDRGTRAGVGAAVAVGGAAAGGAALGSLLGREEYRPGDYENGPEKSSDWMAAQKSKTKRWKWAIIIGAGLIVIGAIIGGVVGGVINGAKHGGQTGHSTGQSAKDDTSKNGDLNINSPEIKALLNNPNLHKVFPGIDYTPINTQYPACLKAPPSQNNVTRDVAVLSQLTSQIRLYGTDCNQTQMVLHAIQQLKMENDVKVWMGIWQDNNSKTNARQLAQMWEILDQYGQDQFEGIILGNEILFRQQMTVTQLGDLLTEVRQNLTDKKITLEVATSDLGDDWTAELAEDSAYVMANVHPFFSGVAAKDAAAWTYDFWENQDGQFFKSDKTKNIITETGWPSAGGTDCGSAETCTEGSVAGIDEMNQFMDDWVCQALANGTRYFWFEAFDEPWKIQYDTPGKNWEDKWGLMDVNRNLKEGVKIPDCGGKTVS